MNRTSLLLFALMLPAVSAASSPLGAQDAPPQEFAAREMERSRSCVPELARLADVDSRLEPLSRRADRIHALNNAVAMEDSLRAAPFDSTDPVEEAVREWFGIDGQMGLEYAAGNESIEVDRTRERERIRQRLRDALEALNEESREVVAEAGDLEEAIQDCDGAILIRSAVLEACEGSESRVCDEARESGSPGQYRFVEEPEDLWDMEELRPWTSPSALRLASNGGLAGARTSSLARRGNLVFVMSLEPMLLDRSELPGEEVAEFDAHLSSLGFTFEDPRFVMVPALSVQLDLPEPVGGETHYMLHFGDLSNTVDDLIWTGEAGGGPLQAVFPATEQALTRLANGEFVSLTAVTFRDEELTEGDAVFTIDLTTVGQSEAVVALVSYMSAQLSRDLTALLPPEESGTP